MSDLPQPGQAPICRLCINFLPDAWELGHPSPCRRVRWIDRRHYQPTFDEEGRCGDFEPRPAFRGVLPVHDAVPILPTAFARDIVRLKGEPPQGVRNV